MHENMNCCRLFHVGVFGGDDREYRGISECLVLHGQAMCGMAGCLHYSCDQRRLCNFILQQTHQRLMYAGAPSWLMSYMGAAIENRYMYIVAISVRRLCSLYSAVLQEKLLDTFGSLGVSDA